MNCSQIILSVVTFRFNIENEQEKINYKKFLNERKAQGQEVFETYKDTRHKTMEPGEYELDTSFLFNNQCNAGSHRLFDFSLYIFPYADIKSGYYIECNDQWHKLQELRNQRGKCGYCGKQYMQWSQGDYCQSCVGNEYLKVSELRLLEIRSILNDKCISQDIPKQLQEKYKTEQEKTRIKIQKSRLNHAKTRLDTKINSAQEKLNSVRYEKSIMLKIIDILFEQDPDFDFDNIIYYSHTNTFCYGWRNSVTKNRGEQFIESLRHLNVELDWK